MFNSDQPQMPHVRKVPRGTAGTSTVVLQGTYWQYCKNCCDGSSRSSSQELTPSHKRIACKRFPVTRVNALQPGDQKLTPPNRHRRCMSVVLCLQCFPERTPEALQALALHENRTPNQLDHRTYDSEDTTR